MSFRVAEQRIPKGSLWENLAFQLKIKNEILPLRCAQCQNDNELIFFECLKNYSCINNGRCNAKSYNVKRRRR
jgi:hypothetical protein